MSTSDTRRIPPRRAARHAAGAALLAVLTLTPITACGHSGTEPQLAALKADRVTQMTLPNSTLIRKSDTAAGKTLGKPVYPEVNRLYDIEDPAAAPGVLAEAVKQATAAGWTMSPPTATFSDGRKRINNRQVGLGLNLLPRTDREDSTKVLPGARLLLDLRYES